MPEHPQALKLGSLIEDKVRKEGLLGVGILSAVVITTSVVAGLMLKGMRRR